MAESICRAEHLEDMLKAIIQCLHDDDGWVGGEVWLPDEWQRQLKLESTWFADSELTEFGEASTGFTFARGEGLPGRVWQSGELEWLTDLAHLPPATYQRTGLAKAAELRTAVALPIEGESDVKAVLVFYARTARPYDEFLAEPMRTVAPQLGEWLQRKRLGGQRPSTKPTQQGGERFYRALIEHGHDVITVLDSEGIIRYESPSIQPLLGYDPEELVGDYALHYVHPDDQRAVQAALEGLFNERGAIASMDFRFRAKDGAWHVLEGVAQNLTHDPFIKGIITTSRDVTDRRRMEQQLQASEAKYRTLFEQSKDGVFITELDGRIVDVNQAAAEMFGFNREELIGENVRQIYERPEERRRFQTEIARHGFVQDFELTLQRRDGSARHCLLTAHVRRDDDGNITGYQAIVRDVTEWRRVQDQLAYLAQRDPLTGLQNRRSFELELDQKIRETTRHGGSGAVLWIDIDRFKEINDTFGHQAGDEVLGSLADRMSASLREDDIMARVGGDEFAALLPQADAERATRVAERLIATVHDLVVPVAERSVRVTVSIGGALFLRHGANPDSVLTTADLSMYQAKEAGRNRFRMLEDTENWHEQLTLTLEWVGRIRDALEHDRFIFHGQPILDLAQGDVHGRELLLRMLHGDDVIMPGDFLETATEFGLIADIDQWVVEKAIYLLGQSQRAGDDIHLMVNLSAKAIGDKALLDLIEARLGDYGVDPSCLTFEVTETDAIANIHRAKAFIAHLKRLGCRFALDDFGVGFASFYHLKHLPVDYLKIDGGFVRDLPNDPVDQHLVRAMVEIARALSMQTVAEFVEGEETLRLLSEMGVNHAQGFHIGKPQPLVSQTSGNLDT